VKKLPNQFKVDSSKIPSVQMDRFFLQIVGVHPEQNPVEIFPRPSVRPLKIVLNEL